MNRRAFGFSVLGMAAMARAAFAQTPPSWSRFRPAQGSLKEKMHTGQPVRSAAAMVDATRAQLQEIIKKQGGVDLFSLDAQHRRCHPNARVLARNLLTVEPNRRRHSAPDRDRPGYLQPFATGPAGFALNGDVDLHAELLQRADGGLVVNGCTSSISPL